MKNNVCILCLVLLCSAPVRASFIDKLFGISAKYEKKITELQDSVNKQMSDNEIEVVGLKSKIDKLEVKMSAQANTVAKVSAGLDKSIAQNAGRDIITKTVNDTNLMKSIFAGIVSICLALIGFMKARITALAKRNKYLVDSRIKYQNLWLMKLDPEFAKIKKEMEQNIKIKDGKC